MTMTDDLDADADADEFDDDDDDEDFGIDDEGRLRPDGPGPVAGGADSELDAA